MESENTNNTKTENRTGRIRSINLDNKREIALRDLSSPQALTAFIWSGKETHHVYDRSHDEAFFFPSIIVLFARPLSP